MEANAEGFGDLDQDHEDDFASFLRPKTPGEPRAATAATQGDLGGAGPADESPGGNVGRPRRGRPPGAGASSSAKLVLWTPVSIRTRMQKVRAETGKKYADQILDALEATIDELPDLVAAATGAKQVQGRLFARRVEAEGTEEVRKQLTIPGVTASHLAVIDELVDSTGAGSRSKLVNVALDSFLPIA